jgi:hypothetical protein
VGNVETWPLRGRRASARNQPRTVFTSLVRAPTSASRIPHIVLRSRAARLGTCTDGRSMRHDTSLRIRASRRSVFSRLAPTPSARTKVAGTTRTSCPTARAASATANASLQVSTTTRLVGRVARYPPSAGVGQRRSSTIWPLLLRTQI